MTDYWNYSVIRLFFINGEVYFLIGDQNFEVTETKTDERRQIKFTKRTITNRNVNETDFFRINFQNKDDNAERIAD